jgi:Fe2+ transport system protein FeoA
VRELPAFASPAGPSEPGVLERLPDLLEAALRVWTDPGERRRLRAFGFTPAHEPGVLKREWHGAQVRVADGRIVVRARGWGALEFRADERRLRHDGAPARPTEQTLGLAEVLVGLIQSYERWVEAREGREGRLRRGHWSGPDPRPVNALAETRRIQRMLQTAWRTSGTRR